MIYLFRLSRYEDVWYERKAPRKTAEVTLLLEDIWWGRLIWDELHQLDQYKKKQHDSLTEFRAVRTWGLTGTPKNDCVLSVDHMAVLLGVDILNLSANETVFMNYFHGNLRSHFDGSPSIFTGEKWHGLKYFKTHNKRDQMI
jgi:hypothetical protein